MWTLDPAGTVLDAKNDIIPVQNAKTRPGTRLRFDDGSILLTWWSSDTLLGARFSQAGEPLTAPHPLMPTGAFSKLVMRSLGSSALLAWGANGTPTTVELQAVDEDGNGGTPIAISTSTKAVSGLDIALVGEGALIAWSSPPTEASEIVVQPITLSGSASAPPIVLEGPSFATNVRVVATPIGAMLVYEGEQPGSLTQVFARTLRCSP
jgi:hypothetical protein